MAQQKTKKSKPNSSNLRKLEQQAAKGYRNKPETRLEDELPKYWIVILTLLITVGVVAIAVLLVNYVFEIFKDYPQGQGGF